ncbi:MAG: DNA-processing protein DprA [Ruminococcus sp.]
MNEHKSIAVVGSRKISAVGAKLAYNAGSIIGKNGFNLVNGLALGCDAEALKGALAAGGKCAVVLPCGINEIYPKSNQWIAEEVLKQGDVLLANIPKEQDLRNIVSCSATDFKVACLKGVLVVEAMEKSGTMHTAEYAKKQNRRLACYYHGLLKYSTGNNVLENLYQAAVIKTNEDLENYLCEIADIEEYTQLSFDFV